MLPPVLPGGSFGVLRGGAGDDELTGSDAVEALEGGAGRNVLHGGPGDDELADDDVTGAGSSAPPAPAGG